MHKHRQHAFHVTQIWKVHLPHPLLGWIWLSKAGQSFLHVEVFQVLEESFEQLHCFFQTYLLSPRGHPRSAWLAGQLLIGLCDLNELLLRSSLVIRVLIRMPLQRFLMIRASDFRWCGTFAYSEDFPCGTS